MDEHERLDISTEHRLTRLELLTALNTLMLGTPIIISNLPQLWHLILSVI